jgi:Flp pilus assembly protein TadB
MENASWQETLLIIWIVFQTLAIPLGFMLGTMGLLVWFFMAIFSNPWTALVPVALGSFVIWLFIRKDREAAAKLITERDGLTGPGAPRRPGL